MTQLLLVGAGNMGRAMLARLSDFKIHVIEPSGDFTPALAELAKDVHPDAVIFAVKPQTIEAILPDYQKRFAGLPLYISIAAGKKLSTLAGGLGERARIIRAMPNTPAEIGEGVTGLLANSRATAADKKRAEQIFSCLGKNLWLTDEKQLDALTAISGSGPAYVFLFLEALEKAAGELGFDPATAKLLAGQTVKGAALLAAQKNTDFAELRRQVTSPAAPPRPLLRY